MNLTGTSDLVRITTTSSADLEVQASWVDQTASTFNPGRTNTIITSATTTTIVGSPAASTQRAVTSLKIRNDHATTANTVTILHTDGTTSVDVWKGVLAAGESVEYDGKFFEKYAATGAKVSGVAVVDTDGTLAANSDLVVATQKATKTYVDALYTSLTTDRIWASPLPSIATLAAVSGTAYAVFLRLTLVACTPKHVEFHVTGAGSGAQTAEVGFFSSPLPPNKGGQTLTKIVADGTLDALTSTGVKRNTTPMATVVPAGTYLWAVIRFAMATGQPTLSGLGRDQLQGRVLELAGASALTGISTLACTVPSLVATTSAAGMELRAEFD